MTTHEAAVKLGISRERIGVLIRTKRLAAVRQGRDWWIEPRALAAVRVRKPGRPRKAA